MLALLLEIDSEALSKSLDIFWKGLLAVILVVGIIMIVTYLMLYISKCVTESKEKKNAAKTAEENKSLDNRE